VRLSRRIRVMSSVVAVGLVLTLTGCSKNPDTAIETGGIVYTENDVTVAMKEAEAGGQVLDRRQMIGALGSYGAVINAMEEAKTVTPAEIEEIGRALAPDKGKATQVFGVVNALLEEMKTQDPEGAAAILGSISQLPPGSVLNPRYGRITSMGISQTFGDVVTVSSEQIQ